MRHKGDCVSPCARTVAYTVRAAAGRIDQEPIGIRATLIRHRKSIPSTKTLTEAECPVYDEARAVDDISLALNRRTMVSPTVWSSLLLFSSLLSDFISPIIFLILKIPFYQSQLKI